MYYVHYILDTTSKIKSFKSKKEAKLFVETLHYKGEDTWFDFMFKGEIVSLSPYYDGDLLKGHDPTAKPCTDTTVLGKLD